MSMSESQRLGSKHEISESLNNRAAQLWGPQRADEIKSLIEQTADNIWQISRNLPESHEEPGFYF